MDESFLVISALGPDRPGLVAEVTHYISQRSGNVEDSRMVVLGGEFGIMILVSGAAEAVEAIRKDLPQLQNLTNLEVTARPTQSPETNRRAAVVPCLITANALDHEGIVRAVSTALYDTGINIVALETTSYNAPVTGSPLFRLEAAVDVPRDLPISKVRESMEAVARAENLDIEVRSLIG